MSVKRKLQKKYEEGEISQEEYNDLLSKLDKLGIEVNGEESHDMKDLRVSGARRVHGGTFGKVLVSGKLISEGAIATSKLRISGKAEIGDNLDVSGDSKISGKVEVKGNASLTSESKVSGGLKVGGDLVSSGGIKVSGKVICGGDFISDDKVKITGKLQSQSVRSTSDVKITGKIETLQDVVAETFTARYAGGEIGGGLIGKNISINIDEVEKRIMSEIESEEINHISDFPSLAKYLVKTFRSIGRSSHFYSGTPPILRIRGDVEGETVEINHAVIEGGIVGNDIVIGKDTEITGVVKYRSTISCPENHNFSVEKI